MNIPKLSTKLILLMYEAIKDVLEEDDSFPEGKKEYGVREYPDFRECATLFENELDKRDTNYEKISWQ